MENKTIYTYGTILRSLQFFVFTPVASTKKIQTPFFFGGGRGRRTAICKAANPLSEGTRCSMLKLFKLKSNSVAYSK